MNLIRLNFYYAKFYFSLKLSVNFFECEMDSGEHIRFAISLFFSFLSISTCVSNRLWTLRFSLYNLNSFSVEVSSQ